jgi:hypothetical protein
VAEGTVPEIAVGLVAAPGAPADVARWLTGELSARLAAEHGEVGWRLHPVEDGLVRPPADDAEIVAAARTMLLAREWDLALCLTDLPLAVARRPVVGHASPVHGVAVLSLPALGALGLRRRALDTSLGLLRALLGESAPDGAADRRAMGRRLRDLAGDQEGLGVRFTARVLTGNLRLLLGMVRANRPWRLTVRLSRALTAALAAGVFALVSSDVWRSAVSFGWARLLVLAVGSVAAIAVTLVVGAGLWERGASPQVRKQVALFNLATTATVVIGVLSLYLALFLLSLGGAGLLVVPALFAAGVGHPVHLPDYLELAWLTCSLATVGGALGAGLETDEAVREAAYTYRADCPPADL